MDGWRFFSFGAAIGSFVVGLVLCGFSQFGVDTLMMSRGLFLMIFGIWMHMLYRGLDKR